VTFVLDASVALSWLLQEEHLPLSDRLYEEVTQTGAIVPSQWRLEGCQCLEDCDTAQANWRGISGPGPT